MTRLTHEEHEALEQHGIDVSTYGDIKNADDLQKLQHETTAEKTRLAPGLFARIKEAVGVYGLTVLAKEMRASMSLVSRVRSHDNMWAMHSCGGKAWPITPDRSFWNGPNASS